jgi:tRNA G18 (ribose-2'-O)-methylase SpoU
LFFGVSHVFTGKKQHCPLNSTVSKTSAGAAELIQTHLVENSKLFVEKWKK